MAYYSPGDQVSDDRKTFAPYIIATHTSPDYDFNAAGYAANAALSNLAKGQVKFYLSTDVNFGSYVTVDIGGVPTVANGITMFRDAATNTGAYIVYNIPDTPNTTFYAKAVLRKTNEARHTTIYWNHTTLGV